MLVGEGCEQVRMGDVLQKSRKQQPKKQENNPNNKS